MGASSRTRSIDFSSMGSFFISPVISGLSGKIVEGTISNSFFGDR